MSSTQSTGLIEARLELAGHNQESVFIALEAIPRRGLGLAVHLRFRVFLAVLGVLHHVGDSHQRLVGAAHFLKQAPRETTRAPELDQRIEECHTTEGGGNEATCQNGATGGEHQM